MSTFKLEIATDNSAFCDFHGNPSPEYAALEIARLLRRAATKLTEDGAREGGLVDANGARVGSFWTEEDEDDDIGVAEVAAWVAETKED